jgi:hypothetical protein
MLSLPDKLFIGGFFRVIMTRITFCIKRNPHISFKKFIDWSNRQLIPKITSLSFLKESVNRFIAAYTSVWQSLGIPKRKYDALFDFWFVDHEKALTLFSDNVLSSIINNMGQTFIDMGKCHCVFTNELPPIFNAEVSTKIGRKPKLRFTSLLIRNHSMSFSDFTKHHREKHIQLFSSVPVIQKNVKRYTVSHRLINETIEDNFFTNKYDGIVEFLFNTVFDMYGVFINPMYLSRVRPDEKHFLDFYNCDFVISHELPPIIF